MLLIYDNHATRIHTTVTEWTGLVNSRNEPTGYGSMAGWSGTLKCPTTGSGDELNREKNGQSSFDLTTNTFTPAKADTWRYPRELLNTTQRVTYCVRMDEKINLILPQTFLIIKIELFLPHL